jgi:hypothetical protein
MKSKITPTNPKGAGRPALNPEEKKLRRKNSVLSYKTSRKELKCMINNELYDNLKRLKLKQNTSYEGLLSTLVKAFESKN